MSITDTVACFSCPLRTLCCLFLISITDTVAWFSSPLDLAKWTKSAFLVVKGGSNEIFTYIMMFREVISFTYQKFLLGDRVPLRVFQECFRSASKMFQVCFRSVSRVFQGCFKGVSRTNRDAAIKQLLLNNVSKHGNRNFTTQRNFLIS